MTLLKFLDQYNGLLALSVAVIIAMSGLVHYISLRQAEERGKVYDRYHKLLDDLNAGPAGDPPYLDRQIAVVYELRNFPEYFPVSLRILESYLPAWKAKHWDSAFNEFTGKKVFSLYDEALLTITFIKRLQEDRSYLCLAKEDRN